MKILALELSSRERSVAVLDTSAGSTADAAVEVVRWQTDRYATPAFGMIEEALAEAGLEREAIDTIAVGLGPGSYTGIRIAIAIARGWELSGSIRTIGVNSAGALAWDVWHRGFSGEIDVVIDAQRREFYHGVYRLEEDGPVDSKPLRLVKRDLVMDLAAKSKTVVGPEIGQWLPEAHDLYPRAAHVAALAARCQAPIPGEQLEPIYLRQPDFVKAPPPRIVPR